MLRERLIELALAMLVMVVLGTEACSWFHALGLATSLGIAAVVAAVGIWRLRSVRIAWRWSWITGLLAVVTLLLWLIEGFTALVSPPNSSDAMAYHMPRVLMWIQQRSVEFFATPYLNQIMLQPLHEYVTLHLQLLSGSDRFANCVAWLSTGGYILAASAVARALGASGRGQALAAFLAATLPNGILQASGSKNEALLSFLLLSLVYYALKGMKWHTGVAFGLACFTKGTAYLFGAPLLLLLAPRAIPHAALALLVINGALFVRNIDLSGSPLGFDSAHADGKYRWRNEYLGWQPTVSNLIRHAGEQLGASSAKWNQGVYNTAVAAHRALGLRESDPATTWPYETLNPPRKTLHETDANNRWHILVFALAIAILMWRRDRTSLSIVGALALGFVAFCFYLKWQPSMARMLLPQFVIAMAIAGVAIGRTHLAAQVAIALLLLDGCRLPLLKSWIRPLQGPERMFLYSREDLYFSDMKPWNVRKQYDAVLSALRASDCRAIALDINLFQLEYPIEALILKDHPDTKFTHTHTTNPSAKYEARTAAIGACIEVCLSCERWVQPIAR